VYVSIKLAQIDRVSTDLRTIQYKLALDPGLIWAAALAGGIYVDIYNRRRA
jgi:hypothetical protein